MSSMVPELAEKWVGMPFVYSKGMIESETIMSALAGKRMMSLGNLAMALGCLWTELVDDIRELEEQAQVRVVTSQCGGGCSSCAGCDDSKPTKPDYSDRSIIICLLPVEDA